MSVLLQSREAATHHPLDAGPGNGSVPLRGSTVPCSLGCLSVNPNTTKLLEENVGEHLRDPGEELPPLAPALSRVALRTDHPGGQKGFGDRAVTMTSGASSRGGRQVFSTSGGGSLYRLCRQMCRILDLTMGLRLGRRLLEETQKVPDFVAPP